MNTSTKTSFFSVLHYALLLSLFVAIWAGIPTRHVLGYLHTQSSTLEIDADTYIEENFPDTAPWNNRNFYIGLDNLYNKGHTVAYLHYNLDGYRQLLEEGRLLEANLQIFQYYPSNGQPYTLNISIPYGTWDEENLTWHDNIPTSQYSTDINLSGGVGYKYLDIASLIRLQALNGSLQDNGLRLAQADDNEHSKVYWSIACLNPPTGVGCVDGQQPKISLLFDVNNPPPTPSPSSPTSGLLSGRSDITTSWDAVDDPDGDNITYTLQVSTLPSFTSIAYEHDTDSTSLEIGPLEDGDYFWRLRAGDGERNSDWSSAYGFTIDTENTTKINLVDEPELTYGNENTIRWSIVELDEHIHSGLLEVSKEADFPDELTRQVTLSYEQLNLGEITISDLADGQEYFYRLRTDDEVGNLSQWTNTVSSTQDQSPPIFADFQASQLYISPTTSPGILDETEISFQIDDLTEVQWTLTWSNGGNSGVIAQTDGSDIDGNRHTIIWKPLDLSDGDYLLQLTASDKFAQTSQSDIILVHIDNTPPKSPHIKVPQDGYRTNKDSVYFTADCPRVASHQVLLDTRIVYDTCDEQLIDISDLNDGPHTLSVQSTDRAGNTSSEAVTFSIDRTPPRTPDFEINAVGSELYLDVKPGSTYNNLSIFTKAGMLLQSGPSVTHIRLRDNWSYNTVYEYRIRVSDELGNTSNFSDWRSFKRMHETRVGGGNDDPTISTELPAAEICNLTYDMNKRALYRDECHAPAPVLASAITQSSDGKQWITFGIGRVNRHIQAHIRYIQCKKRSWRDPLTWFRCVSEEVKTVNTSITPTISFSVNTGEYLSTRTILVQSGIDDGLVKYQAFSKSKPSSPTAYMTAYTDANINVEGNLYDLQLAPVNSNTVTIDFKSVDSIKQAHGKQFRFPFDHIVGVTQWHGHTAYDPNHTGIDFGAVREPIYAMDDGFVRYIGYDTYYGRCNSGGNTLRIEHDNGMQTVFMHLSDYNNGNGGSLKVGQRVSKGDRIGTTGNSGAANCKPLGYHLHMEIRRGRAQSTHVDPVPYIDVDWSQVRTLRASEFPGRLTGDNPHPGY